VFLKDWEAKLDEFLKFNDRRVLTHAGHISKDRADAKAQAEYEAFAARRRALLEAEGQAVSTEAIEQAAKLLPKAGARAAKAPKIAKTEKLAKRKNIKRSKN
jgi:hypothetical protein